MAPVDPFNESSMFRSNVIEAVVMEENGLSVQY